MEDYTNAMQFHFQCAQDKQIKKASHKSEVLSKCWDWRSMVFFNCQSHLNITLQVVHSILTAKIDIKHMDDHILYCAITVPAKALDYITLNKMKSMKDVCDGNYLYSYIYSCTFLKVWKGLIQMYPGNQTPPQLFTNFLRFIHSFPDLLIL